MKVSVSGRFRCNDSAAANAAIVQRLGTGLSPLWQVRSDLDAGRLELVLPEHEPPPIPVYAP